MQDVGLVDAQLLGHDDGMHEGPICSPRQMDNAAGDVPAPQQACSGSYCDTGSASDALRSICTVVSHLHMLLLLAAWSQVKLC